MQMIQDAASTAQHSDLLKKLFNREDTVLTMEDAAKAKAAQISEECRARADREAEATERAAFARRAAALAK